jgi:hypothetical protein
MIARSYHWRLSGTYFDLFPLSLYGRLTEVLQSDHWFVVISQGDERE